MSARSRYCRRRCSARLCPRQPVGKTSASTRSSCPSTGERFAIDEDCVGRGLDERLVHSPALVVARAPADPAGRRRRRWRLPRSSAQERCPGEGRSVPSGAGPVLSTSGRIIVACFSHEPLGGIAKEFLDAPARAGHDALSVEQKDDLTGVLQRDRGAESSMAASFTFPGRRSTRGWIREGGRRRT